MLGYVMVGTNDSERALAFYDAVLGELGARRNMEFAGHAWGYGTGDAPVFWVGNPHDGQSATVGNGTMVALFADSAESIGKVHAKALALGGANEGDPGPRGDSGFYGAYFRDLDGNKICVCKVG